MSRPLSHPHMSDVTVTNVLHALADPTRLAIVSALLKAECGMNCTETTAKTKIDLPKSTCSQHYRILREAGIITSERKGVELTSRVRRTELDKYFPGLLDSILSSYGKEKKRRA